MTNITFFFLLIPVLAIALLMVNFIFASHTPYQEKNSAFECGFHSFLGQNRMQFNISFYIFGLLFLLFDLEILLIYPYPVSAQFNSLYGLSVMLIFFLVLTLGFAFELGKNALKIDSRQYNEKNIVYKSNNILEANIFKYFTSNDFIATIVVTLFFTFIVRIFIFYVPSFIVKIFLLIILLVSALILRSYIKAFLDGNLNNRNLSLSNILSFKILLTFFISVPSLYILSTLISKCLYIMSECLPVLYAETPEPEDNPNQSNLTSQQFDQRLDQIKSQMNGDDYKRAVEKAKDMDLSAKIWSNSESIKADNTRAYQAVCKDKRTMYLKMLALSKEVWASNAMTNSEASDNMLKLNTSLELLNRSTDNFPQRNFRQYRFF